VQVNKHLTKFAAAVAALMMVMSPLGAAFGGGGLVGTAKANQNDVNGTLDNSLTVEDPEPGVTTTHAWYEEGGSSSAASGSKITVSYNTAADDATEGIDVSNVDASDVQRAGIDTDGDGSIEEDITVESTSISNNGKDVTFSLASSHDFDDTEYLVLVYGDVQHPDEGSAGGAGISYGGMNLISGVGVPQSSPDTLPETHDGSEPFKTGIYPGDATPNTMTSYSYAAGPEQGNNATVEQIRYQIDDATAPDGISASNVQKFGVDRDGDGKIDEQLTVSSASFSTSGIVNELTVVPSSNVDLQGGEQIIALVDGIKTPSGDASSYDVYYKYNTYDGFGSNTVTYLQTQTISGTVTDADGNVVSGATVDVDVEEGWTNEYDAAEITTDSNGDYTVTVPATNDVYTLDVSEDGYTSTVIDADVSGGDTTASASLETASYTYDATVEDSSGNALEGATVELLDGSGNVVSSGTTASDGTISLSAPSGTYDVEVSADGYDSASGSADLSTSGASGTFTLSESTYVLDGTVTDASGNAIEGANVTLVDSSGNTVKEASTASDGTYSISGVKSGDYTVEVSGVEDYEDASKDVTVDSATTTDFSLAKTVWTNTYDRPSDGTPGKVFAEFQTSGDAVITVEAHNASSGEWETVVDAKQYSVEGSSNTTDTVEVALDGFASEDYDQYRVTVENVEPSNTGVAEETAGGGGTPGGDGGVPFVAFIVLGGLALAAGGAAIYFEE